MTQKKRPTRTEKVENSFVRKPFKEHKGKQTEFKRLLNTYPIVIATGYAGTGKTYVPCRLAARELEMAGNTIDKIILVRPALSSSKSLGYFKGTKEEKMLEWIRPMIGAFLEDWPMSYIEYMIKIGKIECVPMETVKGHSMKNAYIIIDEAEDLNIKEVKSVLSRIGEGSKMALCGDITQTDLKGDLGIPKLISMLDGPLGAIVGHIDFNSPDDIVRSNACRVVIETFEEIGL